MKYLLVVLCFTVFCSLSSGEEAVPACPDLTEEQAARLAKYTVQDDSAHSQSNGEFVDFYGPKVMVDEDPEACLRHNKVVVNDEEITAEVYLKGDKWFGGSKTKNGKMVKVGKGVYLVKKAESETPFAKVQIIYSSDNVQALYHCLLKPLPEDKKKFPKTHTVITVKKEALTTPLKDADQKDMDAAKTIIDKDKDLFGEIAKIQHPCL